MVSPQPECCQCGLSRSDAETVRTAGPRHSDSGAQGLEPSSPRGAIWLCPAGLTTAMGRRTVSSPSYSGSGRGFWFVCSSCDVSGSDASSSESAGEQAAVSSATPRAAATARRRVKAKGSLVKDRRPAGRGANCPAPDRASDHWQFQERLVEDCLSGQPPTNGEKGPGCCTEGWEVSHPAVHFSYAQGQQRERKLWCLLCGTREHP